MCCGGHAQPAHGYHVGPHSYGAGHSCCCGSSGHHAHPHAGHHPGHGTHGHHSYQRHSHHGSCCCCSCCCCCCCECECEDEICECDEHEDWEELDREEAVGRLEDYLLELRDKIDKVEEHLESLKE